MVTGETFALFAVTVYLTLCCRVLIVTVIRAFPNGMTNILTSQISILVLYDVFMPVGRMRDITVLSVESKLKHPLIHICC